MDGSRPAALAGAVAMAALAACGDDDDGTAADDAPGEQEAEPANAEFCDGFHQLNLAFSDAPEDPAEMEAFVAESVTPNVEKIEGNEPEEIADAVAVMLAAVDTAVTSGDTSALESEEVATAQGEVYPQLGELCDFQTLDVTAIDYEYEGVPEKMEAGPTVVVLSNEAEAEPHEMGLVKLKEGVDIPLEEILSMPEEESGELIESFSGAFAAAGTVSGTTVELNPGRWVYACFIPVGSTGESEGSGPPHFTEGMSGELAVE